MSILIGALVTFSLFEQSAVFVFQVVNHVAKNF